MTSETVISKKASTVKITCDKCGKESFEGPPGDPKTIYTATLGDAWLKGWEWSYSNEGHTHLCPTCK